MKASATNMKLERQLTSSDGTLRVTFVRDDRTHRSYVIRYWPKTRKIDVRDITLSDLGRAVANKGERAAVIAAAGMS